MNNETTCFVVEFERPEIAPKTIWAKSFSQVDDNWVEFVGSDGTVVSSVRADNILAVDRNCRPWAGEPGGQAEPGGIFTSLSDRAALPGALHSVSAAVGPVEAAARQATAARPAPAEPQTPTAAAGGR